MIDDGNYSSGSKKSGASFEANAEKRQIEAVRNSNKEAFRNIFETYYESLLRFAYRYLNSGAEAEGVVQDVFLWIWEKRENWHVEGSLKTYLFRAVKHKSIDRLRHEEMKKKYAHELSLWQKESVQPHTETEIEIDQEKFTQAAREAIEELPEGARIIYKMSRLEGLTYREIADVLEISPKTVESQMSRALDILRTRLSKYMGFLLMVKKVVDSLF